MAHISIGKDPLGPTDMHWEQVIAEAEVLFTLDGFTISYLSHLVLVDLGLILTMPMRKGYNSSKPFAFLAQSPWNQLGWLPSDLPRKPWPSQ